MILSGNDVRGADAIGAEGPPFLNLSTSAPGSFYQRTYLSLLGHFEYSRPCSGTRPVASLICEVFMIEQEKVNRVKILGYTIGVIVFVIVLAAKFVIR